MADEEAKIEEKKEKPAKKGFNFKVILIGLPLFIIQLVLVYFITATFLVKSPELKGETSNAETEQNSEDVGKEGESTHEAAHIYTIEDLIINPAGTNGQRLLLLSVGFGVPTEEKAAVIKDNEVVIKDLILNTVSQKTLSTLSSADQKDSLKIELASKINNLLPKADIESVYFSKYVLN
jgi:flagellar FliL protein